ncbi:MAG: MFS transporter, partial [Burkholderiaceae bacterium]|nr:MFS transporter [Burkholderiaceae bacterium]
MNPAAVALVATTAIQIAAAAAALTLPAIAPVVARDLGVPTSMVGTYIALLYVGSSTAALAGGGIVLRVGAIRLSQLCLIACAAGLALGLVPALAAVAAAAVLVGLGYGPITPASSHVLAKTTPREKMALTFSIKQTGVPAGTALAGLVVPPLAVAYGWHAAVLAIAAACALLAFAAQPLRAALDADRDRSARLSAGQLVAGLRLVAASAPLRTMAAVSFVYAGMQMCVSSFIVAYLAEEIGLSLVVAGLGLTTANVAGVAARIVWGAIADRWLSARAVLAWLGALMAAASALAALFAPGWPLAALLAVAAALGAAPTIESTTDRARALDGADYAITMIQVGGYRPCTVTD